MKEQHNEKFEHSQRKRKSTVGLQKLFKQESFMDWVVGKKLTPSPYTPMDYLLKLFHYYFYW